MPKWLKTSLIILGIIAVVGFAWTLRPTNVTVTEDT